MKKILIKTFGCQMNQYDSSRMLDLLSGEYEETDQPDDADLVIFNTCSIREKASEKLFSELGRLAELKRKKIADGGYMTIVVAGCVAQAEGDAILKRMPLVDIVVGPAAYHRLPDLLMETAKTGRKMVDRNLDLNEKFDLLPRSRNTKGVSEFITVQEGCDKFCAYCIVPYTRGREFSRKPSEILEEARSLGDRGVVEIALLGQNVDNYKGSEDGRIWDLADLISAVAELDGIERIRYMTSYPSQVNRHLIEAHRDIAKLMPYLHLPAQSGSDKILKAMNRRYTSGQYLDLVAELRETVPHIALSSDFIVGFAGETEEDFLETLELVKKVNYASSFSFKYSIRPGTAGEKMEGQIPEEIKNERLIRLQRVLDEQQLNFNRSFSGKNLEVLVEGGAESGDGRWFGRSPFMQGVVFSGGENLAGQIVSVDIHRGTPRLLTGKIAR